MSQSPDHARRVAAMYPRQEGRRMDTYSYGTTPEDVIREQLPHKYSMELNRTDMLSVLTALSNGDENAMSLRSGILSTLDIEEI